MGKAEAEAYPQSGALALPAKYWTWEDLTDSEKHSSLIQYTINYSGEKFYRTGPWGQR